MMASHFLRPVIGMSDLLWGLLDGMNDAGLAVSLTFGGRFVHAPGCGILLVVRYLLETCTSVPEALAVLRRLPISTPQNLTLVDRDGAVSLYVGPDIAPTVAEEVCVTNHQHRPVPAAQEAFGHTQLRQRTLRAAPPTVDGTLAALLRPPLYGTAYDKGMGTLYTAAYRPADGRVSYVWPDDRVDQSFADFTEGEWDVRVGA
jgi:predicted choloylglycine hydrolase